MKVSSLSEFIENVLQHEYDPQKAHEYYLRTRELKGRTPSSTSPTPLATRTGVGTSSSPRRTPLTQTAEQHRQEVKARVEALQSRLEALRKVLQELVRLAQARSGVETTKPSEKSSSEPKLTSSQKKAAAEASKKYYEEHKDDALTPSEQLESLQTKVKAVEAKIQELRDKLKTTINPIRTTDSVGVRTLKR